MSESFGALLRRHRLSAQPDGPRARQQSCLSQNQLARLVGVDPAYVNRLENRQTGCTGSPQLPSRAVILRFADALELDPDERDRFLRAAGHAPVEDWQTRAMVAEAKLAAIALALRSTDHPTALPLRRSG